MRRRKAQRENDRQRIAVLEAKVERLTAALTVRRMDNGVKDMQCGVRSTIYMLGDVPGGWMYNGPQCERNAGHLGPHRYTDTKTREF